MSCSSAIEGRVNSTPSFTTWKNQTTTDLNTLSSSATANPSTLSSIESDIFSTIECTRSKIATLRQSPSNVSTLQEKIVAIQSDLKTKQAQFDVAKERALSISHPEEKASKYEGWFPLNRPMQSTSLFILIGFSIFFTLFFFGMLMSLLGFQIRLSWILPSIGTPGPQTGWLGMLRSWVNPLTIAAFVALVITSGFLISMGTK